MHGSNQPKKWTNKEPVQQQQIRTLRTTKIAYTQLTITNTWKQINLKAKIQVKTPAIKCQCKTKLQKIHWSGRILKTQCKAMTSIQNFISTTWSIISLLAKMLQQIHSGKIPKLSITLNIVHILLNQPKNAQFIEIVKNFFIFMLPETGSLTMEIKSN